MPTDRVKREGIITEEQDPLTTSLAEAMDKCCKELEGAEGDVGCDWCPCRVECEKLFADFGDNDNRMKIVREFYLLKQKRNRILEKRGIVVLPSHEPA